jgi:ABC-type transporter Mla MlaB component
MLKITLHDSASELRFKLEGKLSGLWVKELRQSWQTAQSTVRNRKTVLDLADLEFVDPEGQALLEEMHRQGVTMIAMSVFIRAIVDEVCRSRRCGTVEEQTPNVVASPATAGPDSGAV